MRRRARRPAKILTGRDSWAMKTSNEDHDCPGHRRNLEQHHGDRIGSQADGLHQRQGCLWRHAVRLAAVLYNGGGWSRPASDFWFVGSTTAGARYGTCSVNCTNGFPVGGNGATFPDPDLDTYGLGQPYSFHISGVNSVFIDGSVHFINSSIDINSMAALVTIYGGDAPTYTSY